MYIVQGHDGASYHCLAKGEGKSAVIGDRVEVESGVLTNLSDSILVKVDTRDTELVRMDALGRRPQTLAANLHRVFIVCAVVPELREGLIDRYLVAVDRQGIEAEIVLNKTDLLTKADRQTWRSARARGLRPHRRRFKHSV